MKIKLSKGTIFAVVFVASMAVMGFVSAGIPDAVTFKIENSTQDVFTVDRLGFVNASRSIKTDEDLWVDGSLICSDCVGDEDVSNTLTCSDLQAGSEVVADTEVVNALTIDGGSITLDSNTYTGNLGYNNLTKCSDTQILKMSGASWACAADDSGDAGGNTTEEVQAAINVTDDYYDIKVKESADLVCTDCIGATEITDDYLLNDGDTLQDGDLDLDNADINLNAGAGQDNITDTDSNAYFYFDGNGGLTVHLEA